MRLLRWKYWKKLYEVCEVDGDYFDWQGIYKVCRIQNL